MRSCDCHPWTDEDERIWRLVKNQPRTIEQWRALHDAIEQYKRLLIEDFKRNSVAETRSHA